MLQDNSPDEDEVLRRMLNTPHEKHKPLKDKPGAPKSDSPPKRR